MYKKLDGHCHYSFIEKFRGVSLIFFQWQGLEAEQSYENKAVNSVQTTADSSINLPIEL